MSYEIVEQWKRTGLLNGISEQYEESMAYLLENQRIYNSTSEFSPQFLRLSIPLCRRVFGNLADKGLRVESYLSDSFTGFLETDILFHVPQQQQGVSGQELLDVEAKAAETMSEEIADALVNFAKARRAKVFYLEGFGLENGKIVVFYQL